MLLQSSNTENMVKAILNSIDEAIHAVNADGITIYYNPVSAKHDGLLVEEVLGKHVLDIFPSLNKDTSTLLKVIDTGKPIYNQSQSYKNIRGIQIDTVNSTLPIIANGNVIGAVEIAKDYTKIKQLSQRLLDLQAKINATKRKKVNTENGAKYKIEDIVTMNKEVQIVKEHAMMAARASSPVLLYGETGTGKELFVQAIHNASDRMNHPFIAQNCAALPPTLLESILFGTKKGSFTGAIDRPGLFELADGGTLFLDEMNSMPLEVQAKLLRVLESGHILRVGGTKGITVNVRVIVALNEHPKECMKQQKLRTDLYFRLNVFFLEIPPLRHRKEDILPLTNHFIKEFNCSMQKEVASASEEVLAVFHSYSWPGNVREVRHAIEYAMNMTEGRQIELRHLPRHFENRPRDKTKHTIVPLREELKRVENELIQKALDYTDGNVQKAAQLLNIPRQTLQYKLKKRKDC